MDLLLVALAWVALLSLIAFVLAGIDKRAAGRGARRIPERTLLGSALLGGSPGLLLGMLLFRHKTRKAAFILPFLAIVALQVALVVYFRS